MEVARSRHESGGGGGARRSVSLEMQKENGTFAVSQHAAQTVCRAMQPGEVVIAQRRVMVDEDVRLLLCTEVAAQASPRRPP